jgi:hypothetical protein
MYSLKLTKQRPELSLHGAAEDSCLFGQHWAGFDIATHSYSTPKVAKPVYPVAACVVACGVSLYAADVAIAVMLCLGGLSALATGTVWLPKSWLY